MLRSARGLLEFVVDSPEGRVGKIEDVLFDDERWAIRHFVIQTGPWLRERKLLLSPYALFAHEPHNKRIEITQSKVELEQSPDIDCEMPVSRQHEIELFKYYSWPFYWGGQSIWGEADFPRLYSDISVEGAPGIDEARSELTPEGAEENPHLRSLNELLSYSVRVNGGEESPGRPQDLHFDEKTWVIRKILVDDHTIDSSLIEKISWTDKQVLLNGAALEELKKAG